MIRTFCTGFAAALLLTLTLPPAAGLAYEVWVEGHGAVGDGTTDDTTAIQAAINDASARTNGGAVRFLAKTYKITRPLSITTPGVGLRGTQPGWPGGGGTMVIQTTPNIDGIQISFAPGSALYGCYIENLGLTMRDWNKDTNTEGSGILVQGALGVRLTNVVVLNSYIGIHLRSSINTRIENGNIQRLFKPDGSSFAIYLSDDGKHANASNWISGTVVAFPPASSGENYGLYYRGLMQDLTVRHLEINAAKYGVYLERLGGSVNFDLMLSDLVIDQFRKYGVWVKGFTDGSPHISGGWFANAAVSGEQIAVYADGSNGLRVSGGEFFGFNSSNPSSSAVKISSATLSSVTSSSFRNYSNSVIVTGSSNAVITGNTFANIAAGRFTSHVVVQNSSNRINVTGNTFIGNDNTAYGVHLQTGTTYNLVSNNTWSGPFTTTWLQDSGAANQTAGNAGN